MDEEVAVRRCEQENSIGQVLSALHSTSSSGFLDYNLFLGVLGLTCLFVYNPFLYITWLFIKRQENAGIAQRMIDPGAQITTLWIF